MNLSTSSFQEISKAPLNQGFDIVRDLKERWNQRFTIDNMRLNERFDRGELRLLLPFRSKHSGKRWLLSLEPVVAREAFAVTQDINADAQEFTMLVDIVRFMKSPKHIIPALVRLEAVDELDSAWFNDSLYFSALQGFVFLKTFANRELDFSKNILTGIKIENQYEMVSQMVEGTSQIVKDVTSNRQHVEMDDWEFSQLRRAYREARVLIGASHMSVGFPVSLGSIFEFGEVLFGPLDLYPNSDKSFFRT